MPPDLEYEEETGSQSRVVTFAIYLNLVANTILLMMKIVVVALSSSVSVLASLVDAALDFLSTGIIWVTTRLISQQDQYAYPVSQFSDREAELSKTASSNIRRLETICDSALAPRQLLVLLQINSWMESLTHAAVGFFETLTNSSAYHFRLADDV